MDRTVYYNTESCSTLSENSYSYQSTPIASPKVGNSRGKTDHHQTRFQTLPARSDSQNLRNGSNVHNRQQPINKKVDASYSRIQQEQQQQYYSIPKFQAAVAAGTRHVSRRKAGSNGGALTRQILHSGISRIAVPSNRDRDDIELQYGTVLVLHLQCKNIAIMTPGALDPFYNVKNLYLYKNNIRRIQGLDLLCSLELLDLSRNNVERIDNLESCRRLKKLYLGFNEIQVVEGLDGLENLEELHIDDQDMPPEQPLIFLPGIMASVAHCLIVLDVSSNQLQSLDPIANLPVLHTLAAGDNRIANFESVLGTLESLHQLRVLTLKGNPIARKPNYQPKIIGVVYRLEVLDGKEINDTTRACVQKLRLIKEFRARQREESDMLNKLRKEEERQTRMSSHHIDIGNAGDFNFSTPTRQSPLPPPKIRQIRKSLAVPTKFSYTPEASDSEETQAVIDSNCYESQARNAADDDFLMEAVGKEEEEQGQMSDMAKIIFRLSNLDEVGAGDAGNVVKIKHANYWEFPGSSLPRECRPLSPLEGEAHAGMPSPASAKLGFSASAPELVSHLEKRVHSSSCRPKPAAPGGRRCSNNTSSKSPGRIVKPSSDSTLSSNNPIIVVKSQFQQNQRHVYGRTLSPLMELPTPESLTARDDHKE